jgi:DNA-entry nuclease
MPIDDRADISEIRPTGWHSIAIDSIEGGYLYNRCHLIGYQLSGENANECNLITGTRYMNVQGMLPFENMVADYIKETENHVMYRVTPVFDGNNLVADGVIMEAYSVEDGGDGICFNVYVFNIQPGIEIDYATGDSRLTESKATEEPFVLNKSSKKFHLPSCPSVDSIKQENREDYLGSRELLILQGYEPCKSCEP